MITQLLSVKMNLEIGHICVDCDMSPHLNLSEFMMLCRQLGHFNLADIPTAVFEFNGKLSVLPVSGKRPANPSDLDLSLAREHIATEIIMDGRIMAENLKWMGLEEKWLQKQLEAQGFHSAKEIFLGIFDENNTLTLFENR